PSAPRQGAKLLVELGPHARVARLRCARFAVFGLRLRSPPAGPARRRPEARKAPPESVGSLVLAPRSEQGVPQVAEDHRVAGGQAVGAAQLRQGGLHAAALEQAVTQRVRDGAVLGAQLL